MPDLRQCRRRGASGKSFRILDLIEHYWDQIEGDFAKYLNGVDARDWIRGTRPWDQFLNYCDTVAQERGGRLWAAQLADTRFDDEIEKMLAEQPKNDDDQRPPLEGDSDVVRAIRDLSNDIRHLTRRITRSNIPFLQGPAGPAERIKARKKAIGNARVTEGIAKAIAAEAELDDTQ